MEILDVMEDGWIALLIISETKESPKIKITLIKELIKNEKDKETALKLQDIQILKIALI